MHTRRMAKLTKKEIDERWGNPEWTENCSLEEFEEVVAAVKEEMEDLALEAQARAEVMEELMLGEELSYTKEIDAMSRAQETLFRSQDRSEGFLSALFGKSRK